MFQEALQVLGQVKPSYAWLKNMLIAPDLLVQADNVSFLVPWEEANDRSLTGGLVVFMHFYPLKTQKTLGCQKHSLLAREETCHLASLIASKSIGRGPSLEHVKASPPPAGATDLKLHGRINTKGRSTDHTGLHETP